jgi:mRNA interferase RelE/StbE
MKLLWTVTSVELLNRIGNKKIQKSIINESKSLTTNPERGKPLVAELKKFRSLRVYGGRYRVIYKINNEDTAIHIHVVGIRKEGDKTDVYSIAKKLFKAGLLE